MKGFYTAWLTLVLHWSSVIQAEPRFPRFSGGGGTISNAEPSKQASVPQNRPETFCLPEKRQEPLFRNPHKLFAPLPPPSPWLPPLLVVTLLSKKYCIIRRTVLYWTCYTNRIFFTLVGYVFAMAKTHLHFVPTWVMKVCVAANGVMRFSVCGFVWSYTLFYLPFFLIYVIHLFLI